MKVCHVTLNYYPLYAAPYECTRELVKKGVSVSVVALARAADAAEETVGGVLVRRLHLKAQPRFSARLLFSFLRFARKEIKSEDFDLVHVYSFRGCSFLPLLDSAKGRFWLFDVRTGNVNFENPLLNWIANRSAAVERFAFDDWAAISESVGNQVLGPGRRFQVLPLGTDWGRFAPGGNDALRKEWNLSEERVVVIYAGSLEPGRLMERVLQGFAIARRYHPELFLLVVGEGRSRRSLAGLAGQIGIQNNVCFAGQVPYTEVHTFVQAADIGLAYVPIRRQFDRQPVLKTMEFLSCGLPTVATRTTGNMQIVKDGWNGLLIDDKVEAIAAGLRRLLADDSLWKTISANARWSVREYDWPLIVENHLIPFYNSVLSGG